MTEFQSGPSGDSGTGTTPSNVSKEVEIKNNIKSTTMEQTTNNKQPTTNLDEEIKKLKKKKVPERR